MARILVVEDDLLQAQALEALIQFRGHTICGIANTGDKAIALARTARPDFIIMDVRLPGEIDGVTAAHHIVATRPCGLIFITGYNDGEANARINALRPEAVLSKPCSSKLVFDAIERAITRRGRVRTRRIEAPLR